MPDVPPPEDLPSEFEIKERYGQQMPDPVRVYFERERPIELRPVDALRFTARPVSGALPRVQNIWMRTTGPLPDDPAVHAAVLAYLSDMTLLDTALMAHGRSVFDRDLQVASLDHALWFHRPCRADDWLLYAEDSPSASGARGFTRGQIFSRDGSWQLPWPRKASCGRARLQSKAHGPPCPVKPWRPLLLPVPRVPIY